MTTLRSQASRKAVRKILKPRKAKRVVTRVTAHEAIHGRIPANKGKRFPAEPLTKEEVHALMAACSRRAPSGIRNRALLCTLWRAGIRIDEALSLRPKDLDPEQGSLAVLHGKGDKRRTVAMDPEAWAVLEKWLTVRRESLGIGAKEPVFCTLQGGSVASSYVRTLLPRLAKKAGIEKRVHPHAFRHTYASELARERVPLPVISAALGHSSIATTSRYLQHIAPQEVIETLRGRVW